LQMPSVINLEQPAGRVVNNIPCSAKRFRAGDISISMQLWNRI